MGHFDGPATATTTTTDSAERANQPDAAVPASNVHSSTSAVSASTTCVDADATTMTNTFGNGVPSCSKIARDGLCELAPDSRVKKMCCASCKPCVDATDE